MKQSSRWLVLAAAALFAGACARAEANRTPGAPVAQTAGAHAHHASADVGSDAPLTGMSIYQLDAPWTDQHGATRRLADLAGRPQVIAMVYTNCGSACPLIVGDMKRLEATFPELGLVLVSIDPERDTPGRLHEFAAGSRMGARWTLLNGADDQLMELAAVLGVRYRKVSGTDFMHSNVITVLNARGEVVYRQEALGEVAGTIGALAALASGD